METIDQRQFSQSYVFVRHVNQPLLGGWDLYKNRASNEMVYVKEIKFYSEADRDEYLPRITECAILGAGKDNGFVKCLGVASRNASSEGGYSFSILVLFEYFETTFDKVMLKYINESKTFTIKEILKIATRLASALEVLERNGLMHGDVRSGNIAVMPNGTLKLLWAPFSKTTLELMTEGTNPGLAKVMNPAPEVVDAVNHLSFDKRNLTGLQHMGQDMIYTKNDVYSLGILILKMANLYSSDPFYVHGATIKLNTKKIENGILKLYSLNKRLGVCLNNMLVYDPNGRADFEHVLGALVSKDEPFGKALSVGDVASNVSRRPILSERSENKAIFETDPLGAGDYTLTQTFNDQYDVGDDGYNNELPNTYSNVARPRSVFDNDQLVSEQRGQVSSRYRSGPHENHLISAARSFANPVRDQTAVLPVFGASTKKDRLNTGVSPSPISLFEQRGLGDLKTALITKLENTIFFDEGGRLRPGIKIKESIGSKYVGEMFCGKRSGLGIQYYCNGDVCVGSWNGGDLDGECIYFQADGAVYVGSIRSNQRDGFGKLLHANGDVYEGEWHSNKKNGQGLYFYYAVDSFYEGSWVLNFKEGWGSYYTRSGDWVEGEWKANRLAIQKNQGEDATPPQIKNLLDFYTNRSVCNEMIEKLQGILNDKASDLGFSVQDYPVQSERGNYYGNEDGRESIRSGVSRDRYDNAGRDGHRGSFTKQGYY